MQWVDRSLITGIARHLGEVDRARAALDHALAWLNANPARVMGQEDPGSHSPSMGWIGIRNESTVGFTPHALEVELDRAGFDCAAALSAWHDRGWLVVTPGRRQLRTSYVGRQVLAVAIQPHVLSEIEGSSATEKSDNGTDDLLA
jgi:hypothetical protein